jgi:hypothetical protein
MVWVVQVLQSARLQQFLKANPNLKPGHQNRFMVRFFFDEKLNAVEVKKKLANFHAHMFREV